MANAHSSEQVFLLWVCVNDQTSKLSLVGIFSSKLLAIQADKCFSKYRTIIEERELNQIAEDVP